MEKLKGDCVVLTRNQNEQVTGLGIKMVLGDIADRAAYKDALENCDTVIHMAANVKERDKDLWRVNVDGTQALLDACDGQRFIFVSSIGIYGRYKEAIDENTPPKPQTDYERSKLAAEELVEQAGVPYTILRPTLAFGPNRYWRTIIKLVMKKFPVIGNGENCFHTVYVDDVADVIIKAMDSKHVNQDYNIASRDALTLNETYDTIKDLLGMENKTRHVSKSLIYFLSHITKLMPNSVFIPSHIRRLTRNRLYDVEKAEKNGLACKTTFHDGISRVIEELGLNEGNLGT